MQYNVCIWAWSDYNETKAKSMPMEINIFLFFLSSKMVTEYT